ncbi:MAG: universal stress protein [Vulcanimicrobiota bacterium]
MYRRIMVPLDGSPVAEAALEVAVGLLEPDGELVLVRMQEATQNFEQVYDAEQIRCESYLSIVADRWRSQGRIVHVQVLEYQRRTATVLLEASTRLDCELVVMTSHGRTGLDRRLSGSVSEELARRCSRPVLILGPQTPEVIRIKLELREMSAR